MKNDKDKMNKSSPETENPSAGETHTEQTPKKEKRAKRWTAVDTVIVLMLLLGLGGILLRGFLPEVNVGADKGD